MVNFNGFHAKHDELLFIKKTEFGLIMGLKESKDKNTVSYPNLKIIRKTFGSLKTVFRSVRLIM